MDYERLKAAEEKLDKAVLRQRLLIEELHCQRIKCTKRLRVFVEPTHVSLKVSGRVINDYRNFAELRMSDVLKRFYIQVFFEDRTEIFEWAKGRTSVDSFELDGLDGMKSAKLVFDFANLRDTFRLSDGLQMLLNKRTENRTSFLIDLWKYVRLNNLVQRGVVHCDADLKAIFKVDTFKMEELELGDHLLPLDSLVVDVDLGKKEIFDVEMEMDDLVDFPILYSSKRIHLLKRKIEELQEMIKNCRERVDVLSKFAADPVDYINRNVVNEDRNFFYDILVQDLVFKILSASK